MLRSLLACSALAVLAGCISFSSNEPAEAVPDYRGFCQDKEAQCRQTCGDAGVQTSTCKAGPSDGRGLSLRMQEALGQSHLNGAEKTFSESCERNQGPILERLRDAFKSVSE